MQRSNHNVNDIGLIETPINKNNNVVP